MKNLTLSILALIICSSAYATAIDCKKDVIDAAKRKALVGEVLVSMKRVYGPTRAGEEVYLVKLEKKQTMSAGIDSDLVAVSLWSDEKSGCNVQEAAVLLQNTP